MKKALIIGLIVIALLVVMYFLFRNKSDQGYSEEYKEYLKQTKSWSNYKRDFYKEWAIYSYALWASNNPWPAMLAEAERSNKTLDEVALENATWAFSYGKIALETLSNPYFSNDWKEVMRVDGLDINGYKS